jgi:DNA-binding MarR family transcriptional regulator
MSPSPSASTEGADWPAREEDLLDLDRQVCFPLYAASNLLTRLYRPVLAEIGLTYPQYLVMLVLWGETPQTVGSLGDRLYLDSGTLTPLLKRMELAGLITRTRDAGDERRVLIDLTPRGRNLRAAASKVPATLAAGLKIGPEDVVELRSRVQALVGALRGAEMPG